MFYFLYKPLYIANIGGYLPKPIKGVDLGLAVREGYYLGKTNDYEKLKDIKEFVICVIDEDTAEGFRLLGVSRKVVDEIDDKKTRSLTKEERSKQRKAEKLLAKLRLRHKLECEFQDLPDFVSDNAKMMRFLLYLIKILINSLPETFRKKILDKCEYIKNITDDARIDSFEMSEEEVLKLIDRQCKILRSLSSYREKFVEE